MFYLFNCLNFNTFVLCVFITFISLL